MGWVKVRLGWALTLRVAPVPNWKVLERSLGVFEFFFEKRYGKGAPGNLSLVWAWFT